MSDDDAIVGVETLDDVAGSSTEGSFQEQDKFTTDAAATVGDRHESFWKTLNIWLKQVNIRPKQYFLVTRARPIGELLIALQDSTNRRQPPKRLIALLRKAGAPTSRRSTKIQTLINSVLNRPDEELKTVLERTTLIHDVWTPDDYSRLISIRFGIERTADREAIYLSLKGWVSRAVFEAWSSGAPAWIRRSSCVAHCRSMEQRFKRRRVLPRPAEEVPIDEQERARARDRTFVAQLTRIDAPEDDLHDAIEQFLRFCVEKHRIAETGDVPVEEWSARDRRLSDRWKFVKRQIIEASTNKGAALGREIFRSTVYNFHDDIDGERCNELYMTAGHYHRLADSNTVWWHPDHDGSRRKAFLV